MIDMLVAFLGGAPLPAIGDFVATGTTTWTCPPNVTIVSVVCVGKGATAGWGGGLAWRNNIAVTPGAVYTVTVDDQRSRVEGWNTEGLGGMLSGGFTGEGGGNGGNGYYGGGGAGGYTGNGGATNAAGAGGGGGGGNYYNDGSTETSAGGGGVGLYGQGASGAAGPGTLYGGLGGSGGNPGGNSPQVGYGGAGGGHGGGGGYGWDGSTANNGTGGGGAVRIMWGGGRSFPNNAGYMTPQ